jgi:hypothetical protein
MKPFLLLGLLLAAFSNIEAQRLNDSATSIAYSNPAN